MRNFLIKEFNTVAVAPETPLIDPAAVNTIAVKAGYSVMPEACTAEVVEFLKQQSSNFNTTFYKSWQQVKDLSEQQMIILQLLHYLSTYGTDYTGSTFTLNPDAEKWHFDSLKVITACSPRQLFDRIEEIIETPVALSKNFLGNIYDQLEYFHNYFHWALQPDAVTNRELKTRLRLLYGIMPDSGDEIVGVLFYAATRSSLVIKNRASWNAVCRSNYPLSRLLRHLTEKQIEALASVFYRYKPFFLALRHALVHQENAKSAIAIVNRISKLAPRLKKPFVTPPLQSLLARKYDDTVIENALRSERNPFYLVRLLNYLKSATTSRQLHTYIIRNGKVFVKSSTLTPSKVQLASRLKAIAADTLNAVLNLESRDTDGRQRSVAFPQGLELAAPMSEKMFVGNIPYGSYFKLLPHSYIGIYWRNAWGTHDFDLWMVDTDGNRIGWSAKHKNGNILFSGDMTNANPEATEVMYCSGKWPDCTIRVNRYNGRPGSLFRLFFGTEEISTLPLNYMVPPESIRLVEDMESENVETTIAVIKDNVAYFSGIQTGNRCVPGENVSYEEALGTKFGAFISLREVLLNAGFREAASDEKADIDLRHLQKDTILRLFKPLQDVPDADLPKPKS